MGPDSFARSRSRKRKRRKIEQTAAPHRVHAGQIILRGADTATSPVWGGILGALHRFSNIATTAARALDECNATPEDTADTGRCHTPVEERPLRRLGFS